MINVTSMHNVMLTSNRHVACKLLNKLDEGLADWCCSHTPHGRACQVQYLSSKRRRMTQSVFASRMIGRFANALRVEGDGNDGSLCKEVRPLHNGTSVRDGIHHIVDSIDNSIRIINSLQRGKRRENTYPLMGLLSRT